APAATAAAVVPASRINRCLDGCMNCLRGSGGDRCGPSALPGRHGGRSGTTVADSDLMSGVNALELTDPAQGAS
ncbi:hypothetical protein, partial [Micromonospora sp. BL4]|uniref:hypothetical protein n=1 Tax=Micromonospora sp. BL4 TaxID=2478710 RepID=UPI001F1E2185